MSASSKKQLRKEERMAQMTERQKKEQAEAKKLKIYTAIFVSVMALILVAFITIVGVQHITAPENTTALTVGDHDINSVVMTYYYNDSISSTYQEYYNYYGDNAALVMMLYTGLDVSTPMDQQQYSEDMTWADYFLDMAMQSAKNDYVLYDLAEAEGFELPEEYQETYDALIENKEYYAELGKFPTVSDYLEALYGTGADIDSYSEYVMRSLTASAYYNAYSDSLEFDATQLSTYENEHINEFSSYDYAYAYLSYTDFATGTKDENGSTTYTDEEKAAALAAAKAAAEKLANDSTTLEELNANYEALLSELEGVEEEEEVEATEPEATEPETTEPETEATEATEAATEATEAATEATEAATEATEATTEATEPEATEPATEPEEEHDHDHEEEDVATSLALDEYSRYGSAAIPEALREWITNSNRKQNDIAVIANETTIGEGEEATTTTSGYYVVCFQNRDDNNTVMGNVRHVLIAPQEVEGEDGKTAATEKTWEVAKTTADMFLRTWIEEGNITAESFEEMAAGLVEEGSAKEEGLFEDIHTDSEYVESFRSWAIDANRKAGDTEVIESEYGYHIMFYVGASEQTYREYLVEAGLLNQTLEAWYDEIMKDITFEVGNTSRMNLGLTLASN